MARLRFSAAAAYRHLRNADPVVGALIDAHGPYRPRPSGHPYDALVRAILFQQLDGRAAAAIQRRLYALYDDGDGRAPTPTQILATTDERSAPPGSPGRRRATSATSRSTPSTAVSTSRRSATCRTRR